MKGKSKFTIEEFLKLKDLIREFSNTNDISERKKLRVKMRRIGFYVSDFGIQNISPSAFSSLVKSGHVSTDRNQTSAKNIKPQPIAKVKPKSGLPSRSEFLKLEKRFIDGNFLSPEKLNSIDGLDNTGLYILRLKKNRKFPNRYQEVLKGRTHQIIYIGKAENSTLKKRLNQELRAKGHGTFFRSLGAVLGYRPPNGSLRNFRNQNNYKFNAADERKIITWIKENLELNWIAYNQDFSIEKGLILKYYPLLNQTHNPFKLSILAEDKASCRTIARN